MTRLPAPPGSSPAIGLIGLGLIGSALAERLLGAGFQVLGYDVSPEKNEALQRSGGAVAPDAAAVFAQCDRVLLSLPTHREVAAVVGGCESVLRDGHLIVDTTTGDPEPTEELARKLAARGVVYLDATISGSSTQVRAGSAVLMVGGEAAAFAACADLFNCMGREAFHTGPAGSGARMKLVTNLVLGLNRAALAEGLAFGTALGLDPVATLAVMRGSAAYSKIMDTKGERMITGNFQPEARLSQHLKDVRLIVEAGRRAGLAMPLSGTHQAVLEAAEAAGCGELDNSAIYRVLAARQTEGGS